MVLEAGNLRSSDCTGEGLTLLHNLAEKQRDKWVCVEQTKHKPTFPEETLIPFNGLTSTTMAIKF
jgi:hypothetical protein